MRYETEMSGNLPVWYNHLAPLGSAVRYIAALSPRFRWVGIYKSKGKKAFELGPTIGEKKKRKAASELAIEIRDRSNRLVGRLEIDGARSDEDELVRQVRKVVKELGELWPA